MVKNRFRKKFRCRSSIAVIAASIQLASVSAFTSADENKTNEPALKEKNRTISGGKIDEEILVIGTQFGLNLTQQSGAGSRLNLTSLETPASVTLVSEELIRKQGLLTVNEAITLNSPGIGIRESPGSFRSDLTSRGFVGNYSITRQYDGITMGLVSSTATFPFDAWTAERVEALSGPSSVLYGHGAIGGSVNVVPKTPQEVASTEILIGLGTFADTSSPSVDSSRLAFSSTGPLAQNVYYSADVTQRKTDGWHEDGEAESLASRLALRWDVNSDLKFILAHDHSFQDPNTSYGTPLIDGRVVEQLSRFNYNADAATIEFEDNWTTLKTEWSVTDGITVENMSYHLTSDRREDALYSYRYNADTGLISFNNEYSVLLEVKQWGDRLNGRFEFDVFGRENTLLVGAEYSHYHLIRSQNNRTTAVSPNPTNPFAPIETPIDFGDDDDLFERYQIRLDSYAVFIENQYKVTDFLSLVGGLRYDFLDFSQRYGVSYAVDGRSTPDPKDTDKIGHSWQMGAVYTPFDNTSIYARYATGLDLDTSITSLDEEEQFTEGEEYEVGIKQSAIDGKLEWTVSVYDLVKSNILTQDPNDLENRLRIGEQSSRGIEASAFMQVTDTIGVSASGTILDARYDEFTRRGVNLRGKTPRSVPEKLMNFHVYWEFLPGWESGLHARYIGRRYYDFENELEAASYSAFDLSLSKTFADEFKIQLNARNIFDKYYVRATYRSTGQYIPGDPRSVSLDASWFF